jgi:hypothetical protein
MAMCIIPAAEQASQALNSKDDMADDDLDADFDPDTVDEEIDEEVDPDVIDPDAIEDDLVDEEDDDGLVTADEFDEVVEVVVPEVAAAAVAPAPAPAPAKKKGAEDEEDDEEELDPDDVEADLDAILKVRIAAADEDEDDEELDEVPAKADAPDGVVPKRANEFMCPGCFLLVNRGQFGPESNLQCPVGESECPAIGLLQAAPAPARPRAARSGRKR